MATRGKYVLMILVDNGLGLNVFLLKITRYLRLRLEDFIPIEQTEKAYNNSKREVVRIVTIDVTIGQLSFLLNFKCCICFKFSPTAIKILDTLSHSSTFNTSSKVKFLYYSAW